MVLVRIGEGPLGLCPKSATTAPSRGGGAGLLAIVVGEGHSLVGDSVDVRRLVANQPVGVRADVGLADVVAPDDQDVGLIPRIGGTGAQCGQR